MTILITTFAAVSSFGAKVSPGLQTTLQTGASDKEVSVIITLSYKADLTKIGAGPKSVKRDAIVKALKDEADRTQGPLKAFLRASRSKRMVPFWITNAVAATIPTSVVNELVHFPGVETIEVDKLVYVPPVIPSAAATPSALYEWNISQINAPALSNAGITGTGAVVANVDTGVDPLHADLAGKWRGGTKSWYSVFTNPANAALCGTPDNCTACELSTTPCDADGHGTGTMGVMVGGNAGGTAIGVAPGAKWIAVKIFPDPTTLNPIPQANSSLILDAYQWLIALPEGTAPDVINNSYGAGPDACDNYLQSSINNLRLAGIEVVFSAGNGANNVGLLSSAKDVGAADGSTTVFDVPSLASAVRPASVNISGREVPLFATGNGITTIFDTTLLAPGIPNSVKIFINNGNGNNEIGTDDGSGHIIAQGGSSIESNLSTIDYATGALHLVFSIAPAGSLYASYNFGIGTDDGVGPIGHFIAPSGSSLHIDTVNSTIDYVTGALHLVFSTAPASVSITAQYEYGTSYSPANNQGAFAVGTTDSSNNIASFSSRGPNVCDGSIFPHVVAPGVNIKLADLTLNGAFPTAYIDGAGTSFSAPHVSGATALLTGALPALMPDQIEIAFRQTAVPLPSLVSSPNDDYGYGLIDVAAAYKYAFTTFIKAGVPQPQIAAIPSSFTFDGTAVLTTFTVVNQGTADLVINPGGLAIAGANPLDFIIPIGGDACSGQTITALSNCNVSVAFAPTAVGTDSAQLSIVSNDTVTQVLNLALIGTALTKFNLILSKTGTGSATVIPSTGTLAWSGNVGTASYASNTAVSLTAIPDTGSTFEGWGGDCPGANLETYTKMNSSRTCTAAFISCSNQPVQILDAPYPSIQEGYDNPATEDGSAIKMLATSFIEAPTINRNISVILQGGYTCGYSDNAASSVIKGSLTINQGTVTIESILIQ